jgi:hypothetical protein
MIGRHNILDNPSIFCTAGALHRVSSEIIIPPLSLTLLYDNFHRQCVNNDYLYPFFLARYANPRHATIRMSIIIIIINNTNININALAITIDTNR